MKIAVIGIGNVGGTLARAWVRAGHEVVSGVASGSSGTDIPGVKTSTVVEAVQGADVVVLSVPWSAVPEVLGVVKDWSGKVVIDCTNPIAPGFELAVGFNTSGAEKVASLATGSAVVKAFNTTGFDNMQKPRYDGRPLTMLFCTDDPTAQHAAEHLIADVGFEPVFAGPLKQARFLEPLAMLWITMSQRLGRDFALTLVRR
jgi:8-hydroxy-5-deazaflavin:NADPH oxidoreductase